MKVKLLHQLGLGILLVLGVFTAPLRGETFPDFFNSRLSQGRFFNQSQFFNRNAFSGQSRFRNESPFLGNFSQFNDFNNTRDLIIQRGGFEFFGDAEPVAGFNRILRRGNQLVGQTINGNQMSLFIDGRGNLVDRTGRRVAARDPEIVRQAQSFFLQNRQTFQGAQRNSIDRFLFASGGFGRGGRLGRMTIDLASLSLKENGDGNDLPKGVTRVQAGLASLNFLVNTIQSRCLIKIFENQIDLASGTISIDFNSFRDGNGNLCFSGETLSLMEASDTKAICNNGKIRINELINNMLQPVNYNRAQGIAGLNRSQVAQAFGMSEDKLDTFGNKLLVGQSKDGRKESGVVGGPQRVLERQIARNIPGRMCYRSLDFKDIHESGAGSLARNVEESGILFTHEAEEWLCIGANGFMMTFLFDQNGTLIDEAPGSIASSPGLLSPAVRNPASCLDCHSTGFRGGEPGRYTEQKGRIRPANQPLVGRVNSSGGQLTHGDYFTTNDRYNAIAQTDSNLFVEAQKRSGAWLWDPDKNKPVAVLPSSMEAYNSEVNSRRMARELGITEDLAKKLLGDRQGMMRSEFDAHFCEYKKAALDSARSVGSEKAPTKPSSRTNTPVNHNARPEAQR
jgi:hypothetical protein